MQHDKYDIIIVGAGIAGLTALLLLVEQGWRVALLEKGQVVDAQAETQNIFPSRVVAINPHSQRVFTTLGVWDDILAAGKQASRFETLVAHDNTSGEKIEFDSARQARSELGWIVPNNTIIQALWQRACDLQRQGRVAIFTEMQAKELRYTVQGTAKNIHAVPVAGASGLPVDLQADLVVAADGMHSWVRTQEGFRVSQRDYRQQAAVAVVKHTKAHLRCARQVFAKDSILAFLPLADPYHSSIVWSQPVEKTKDILKQSVSAQAMAIGNAFDCHYGAVRICDELRAYPLSAMHADNYVRPHVVLIGDAAHHIHPLAGQGANLGVADAECLQRHLQKTRDSKRTANTPRYLESYASERLWYNQLMQFVVDVLAEGFNATNPLGVQVRAFGLQKLNRSQLFKYSLQRVLD